MKFSSLELQRKEVKRGKMYRLKYFSQLMYLTILFAVSGCIAGANPSSYPNPLTALPTLKITSTSDIQPIVISPTRLYTRTTPTNVNLPQVNGPVGEYCWNQPPVFLPISETQGLTDDDIAKKLMSLYLDYYNNSEAPGYCRIDGYHVDEVSYEERFETLIEYKGDFLRAVLFSVKLVQVPNQWMSFSAGDIDQENNLHIGVFVAVFRSEDGHLMEFAHGG